MFRRYETNSIRFRMCTATAGIALILLCILFICFCFSAGIVRTQVYATYQSILSTYSHGVQSSLGDVETFLISRISDNHDLQIIGEHGSRWSLAAARQQKDLTESIVTHSMVDGFFIYEPDHNLWVDATVSNYSNQQRRAVRGFISAQLDEPQGFQQINNWKVAKIRDEYVFFRILRAQGCYVGAWVSTNTLTEDFKLGEEFHAGRLILGSADSCYLEAGQQFGIGPEQAASSYQMEDGYMMVAQKCEKIDAYLVLLLQDDSVTRELDGLLVLLVILSVCALLAVAAMFFTSYRLLAKPLTKLSGAMLRVQNGDWDIRLPEETELDEYADINATFNHMVEQVENLKIHVYEQKNEKLYIENQMLKQQMAPHTLINCLNTIHGLAGSGKTDLVQLMAEDLGRHLRYLLSGNQTVRFRQEMDHARNYVEICNIRYADSIRMEENVDAQLLDAQIPPLMVYGFVENSIKYALSPSRQTIVSLKAWKEGINLRLQMWDNGPGYDQTVLDRMAMPGSVSVSSSHRIGLVNLCRRAQLLYGSDEAYIRFSNREEGGARMDVTIPYTTKEGWVQ